MEKPNDPKHHLAMLKKLRNSKTPHKVFTAVSVIVPMEVPIHPGYVMKTHLEETQVKFDPSITDEFLEAYVRCGEGSDKAGGYAIQVCFWLFLGCWKCLNRACFQIMNYSIFCFFF